MSFMRIFQHTSSALTIRFESHLWSSMAMIPKNTKDTVHLISQYDQRFYTSNRSLMLGIPQHAKATHAAGCSQGQVCLGANPQWSPGSGMSLRMLFILIVYSKRITVSLIPVWWPYQQPSYGFDGIRSKDTSNLWQPFVYPYLFVECGMCTPLCFSILSKHIMTHIVTTWHIWHLQ